VLDAGTGGKQMCETKRRIGETLHDIMLTKPIERITVQDIMDSTKMKRQSFYYHFQDIYDVLEWELNRRLFSQLAYDPEVSFDDWAARAVQIANGDKVFYYRALEAQGREKTMAAALPAARLYVGRMLTGRDVSDGRVSENEKFMIDFMSEAVVNYAIDQLSFRKKLTDGQARIQAEIMLRNVAGYSAGGMKNRRPVHVFSGEKEAERAAVSF
jgi:AcrR family transcriptional regulator